MTERKGMMQRMVALGRGPLPKIAMLIILALILIKWIDGVGLPEQTVTTKALRVDLVRYVATSHTKGRTGYRVHIDIDGKRIVLPAQTLYPIREGQVIQVRYRRGRFTGAMDVLEARPVQQGASARPK